MLVKSVVSIWAKAKRNRWGPDDALMKTDDILGLQIVCNNLEDVERAKDILLSAPELTFEEGSKQDYFKNPKDSYRALHFIVVYEVTFPNQDGKIPIKCEIQLRTYLSDTWARLSHWDFFKETAETPEPIKKLLNRLASLLSLADDIAQDIRELVSQPRPVPSKSDTEFVNADALAFIYQRAFQTAPPDYTVRIVAENCKELNITRSDVLDRKLNDKVFLEKLKTAYSADHGLELYDESLFELIPIAAAMGDRAAIDRARQSAEKTGMKLTDITSLNLCVVYRILIRSS